MPSRTVRVSSGLWENSPQAFPHVSQDAASVAIDHGPGSVHSFPMAAVMSPQTRRLKTTHIFDLTVLEVRRVKWSTVLVLS